MKCYVLTVTAYTVMKKNIGGIKLMLPDEMEAEKNRKIILAQADEIDILKRNVRDLQGQYQSALIHNKKLIEQKDEDSAIISHLMQEIDAREEV